MRVNEVFDIRGAGRVMCGLLLFVSGCAGSKEQTPDPIPRRHNMKVSVHTNGAPVTNFQAPLVHRIDLTSAQLHEYYDARSKRTRLPFSGQPERDGRGKVMGVRIAPRSDGRGDSRVLGLAAKDLLTAVNRTPAADISDFAGIFQELQRTKTASATVERNGVPHKILFYLIDS